MKPRRLLLSVATLPTITESHEDLSQSLEEYINSIKELAQPACGPLRISRTQRRKPMGKHVTLRFNSQMDRGSKDPLDWLFAQTAPPGDLQMGAGTPKQGESSKIGRGFFPLADRHMTRMRTFSFNPLQCKLRPTADSKDFIGCVN
uniref:Uncharacterized protein n=1 Tax=Sinocyclocheilus grahami TaxID=75366 RepID=A0A672Q9Q2_SINGR